MTEWFFKHVPATYDLLADLSVPSWWPSFNLKIYAAWSPQWKEGEVYFPQSADPKKMTVYMQQNSADMNALTDLILERGPIKLSNRRPTIMDVAPYQLSACDTDVTLQIRGRNIWRADQVTLGAKLFGADAAEANASIIRVMPDMQGILATVDMSKVPVLDGQVARLSVVTKDGQDTFLIPVKNAKGSDGKCTVPAATPPKPTGPQIKTVAPSTISICDASPQFTITGENLKGVISAALGTVDASKPTVSASGKSVVVKLRSAALAKKLKGLDKTSLILRTDSEAVVAEVQVGSPADCK
mgnify:FL=1